MNAHTALETLEVLNKDPKLKNQIVESMRDTYKKFLAELNKLKNCKGCAKKAASQIEPPPPPPPVNPNIRPKNTDELRRLLEQMNGRPA